MKHGQNCDCMMCTIGKKMGMIQKPKDNNTRVCTHCDQEHKAGSTCDRK